MRETSIARERLQQWPAEPPWTFRERLAQPQRPRWPHDGVGQSAADPGTVAIDGRWTLAVEGSGPPLEAAASEIRRFLAEAGVVLRDAGERSGSAGPVLRLRGDQPAAPRPTDDEAYRLAISPDGILVEATGPRGVLQGVYALEEAMAAAGGPWLHPGAVARRPFLKTRILRSFWSPYYVDELTTDEDYYPAGYLETLSRMGINGIWIHGYLQEIVPSTIFPEFGRDAQSRLIKLNALIERAARFGIDVFIYFCEPKALAAQSPFWEQHPDVRGRTARGNPMDEAEQVCSICTSSPQGQAYIEEAYCTLFREAPGLGGVILITASENHSHCYSHGRDIDCPRCAQREPAEVVAELIGLVQRGARRANPLAQVIAWTWSWSLVAPDPQADLIERLPEGVAVMSDFERGDTIVRGGKTYPADEYSMTVVGPSPRFQKQAKAAHAAVRPLFAKMQLYTTHELVTVPYYPVPWRLAEKWRGLQEQGVEGVMACWIFGNAPCFLMEVTRELTWEPHPPVEAIIAGIARRIFGAGGVDHALAAWRHFGDAFDHYPFSVPLLYFGPMNRAPALPWTFPGQGKAMTPSWRVFPPGDTLADWTRPFGPALAQECFEQVLARWETGLAALEREVAAGGRQAGTGEPTPAEREWIVAQAFAAHIRSTVHFLRFGQARDALQQAGDERAPAAVQRDHLEAMSRAIAAEVENRTAYLPLVRADNRLGYHSEAEGYFFTAAEVGESLAPLEALRRRLAERLAALQEEVGGQRGA